jgi:hypothetical protein
MSNKKQRNRRREYARQAIAHAKKVAHFDADFWAAEAEKLAGGHVQDEQSANLAAAQLLQAQMRKIHAQGGKVACLMATKDGGFFKHSVGFFKTRAAALRALVKAGYTHVTGSGVLPSERGRVRAIRQRFAVV